MNDPASLQVAVPVVRNLLVGVPVMVACIVLQALLVIAAMRFYREHLAARASRSFTVRVGALSGVMLVLVLGNMAQVVLWALLFRLLGEFAHLGDAIYHSAVNFATLGYGDIVMSAQHRMLGPLEAINGALMIGVSTGALSAAFQDIIRRSAVGAQHRPLAGR